MKNENQEWADGAIVKAIQTGLPAERDAALHHLFTNPYFYHSTRQFVLSHRGSEQDAEDVFQEVFIIFDRNIRQGNFEGKSSLHTYFLGIVKHFWKRYTNQKGGWVAFDNQLHDTSKIELEDGLSEVEKKIVDYALSQLSDKCKEILLLTGILDTNAEIAEKMGLSSADMAKKEVYRCREKFRYLMKKHPNLEFFLKIIIEK